MSENRKSAAAQLGYLTGKVEAIDARLEGMDSRFNGMDEFLREHMEKEERNNSKQYVALGVLAVVIVLQSAGLSLKQIFDLVSAIL